MSVDRPEQSVIEPCGLTFVQLGRLPDGEVMAHLQAGHDEALAVLFDRFHRLVLSVAHKILHDIGEVEDIVQAVFFEMYQHASQYDPSRGSVKIWLLQLAYHSSLSRRQYLKSRGFYDPVDISHVAESEKVATPFGPGILALSEMRTLVREGLEHLNARQRRTLHLAHFEGLSLKEIAEETGESLGNVRHHYYRGLRQLRSLLLSGNGKVKAEPVNRGVIDAEA